MRPIIRSFQKDSRTPAAVVLLATILLSLPMFTNSLSFRAPQQEYENNDVKVSRIIFSKAPGFYRDPFTLKIKAPTTEIYYTLDGTEPVRGQEGTFRYTKEGIEISDATANENTHCMRTDVTTGFDLDAVEELSLGRRVMNYQVPDYSVDKCTIIRAVFYDIHDARSEIQTGAWFVGYEGREGYGTAKIVSIITDPANLFDYEKGIYVTGKTFDQFAEADSFHDDSVWYRHFWWWWDANYNRKGRDWERPASVLFFSEKGELLLQQQAGIRIQGGGSRGFLPKSLNLYARRDYDGNTRFHYDFFGTGFEAKRLTLTCGGDDCYTKQKDRLVAELTADQDFATMHYEPCFVFLDGEFWGLYFLTEKYDSRYFSYYYKVPEEEVLEIKNNKIEIGNEEDLALYEEMRAFIDESDMSVQENYDKACEMIDMDSFINYYAALIYCGRSGDWPNGNFAVWRTRPAPVTGEEGGEKTGEEASGSEADSGSEAQTASGSEPVSPGEAGQDEEASPYRDGRWRWILFDVNSAAISSELKEHDTLHYVRKANKMKMFGSLCKNPTFREKFAERILEYGQTVFSPESVNEKVESYASEMTGPMELHFRRFFGEDSGLDFTQITQTEICGFFEDRYSVVEQFLQENYESIEEGH